jgi:5-methyltetrahydropteroyltriglutamate--homocysteine methyltransferase
MLSSRAETVGSFLRPDNLLRARDDFKTGRIAAAELRAIEDEAIRDVAAMQEDIGFRILTDGEFRRENWWVDFVAQLRGVEITEGSAATSFDKSYVPKHVRTTGKLGADHAIVTADYQFLASITQRAAKITIPSPTRLHFHGGRAAVSRSAYPDIDEFFADVARVYRDEIARLEAAGCRYIQVDDPLLTYFLSPKLRAEITAEGDEPDRRLTAYLELLNQCLADRQSNTTVGIHLCRGNARSEWISEGTYEGIAERCFGTLDVDRYLLEFDDERSGSFDSLRFMPRSKTVVLGLITTKTPQLENKELVKQRLEQATRFVALDRLAISPQCGFASVVEGNKVSHADQRAKLQLVVEIAQEVWGTA